MKPAEQLILYLARTAIFRGNIAQQLVRAAMVLTFFAFGIQKWNAYTAGMLAPLINHSPVVFWLIPALRASSSSCTMPGPKKPVDFPS